MRPRPSALAFHHHLSALRPLLISVAIVIRSRALPTTHEITRPCFGQAHALSCVRQAQAV
eukprot:2322484-Alexandrium_andersonii.AAC.1